MQEQASPDKCRVTIENTGQTFVCGRDELILDAGLVAGIGLPHNCRGGACGTCKSEVLEGSVDHGWVMSFAITDDEKAAGKCLICQSKPTSENLVIRPDLNAAPHPPAWPPKRATSKKRRLARSSITRGLYAQLDSIIDHQGAFTHN